MPLMTLSRSFPGNELQGEIEDHHRCVLYRHVLQVGAGQGHRGVVGVGVDDILAALQHGGGIVHADDVAVGCRIF